MTKRAKDSQVFEIRGDNADHFRLLPQRSDPDFPDVYFNRKDGNVYNGRYKLSKKKQQSLFGKHPELQDDVEFLETHHGDEFIDGHLKVEESHKSSGPEPEKGDEEPDDVVRMPSGTHPSDGSDESNLAPWARSVSGFIRKRQKKVGRALIPLLPGAVVGLLVALVVAISPWRPMIPAWMIGTLIAVIAWLASALLVGLKQFRSG